MKKTVKILLIIAVLLFGLLLLTGCDKAEEKNSSSKSGGFDLELDFKYMNDKVYKVHMNKNSNDEITEYDEDEPNYARIENEKENYVLDLTLDTEAKDAYEQFETSAKEDCDEYHKTKFGKYEGYYALDGEDIFGYVLLDESDETFNVFVMFDLYLYDEDDSDIQKIYGSKNIENILNNIEFKVSK